MNSSMSSHAKISKQRLQVTNAKQGFKLESKQELTRAENEKVTKRKQHSSSLSKEEKALELALKFDNVDRNVSKRYSSKNALVRKNLTENKKSDIEFKKSTSSSSSRKQTVSKSKDSKAHSIPSKLIKPSAKASRLTTKGPSGKTNVEIAKSFVQSVTGKKNKKTTKSNSTTSSEKLKSNIIIDETAERPRTSTIRKGAVKSDILIETKEKEIGNEKNHKQHLELEEKYFDAKSADEDDDKVSYEEDFEDYDSDFEDSESDSSYVSEASKSMSDDEEKIISQNVKYIKDNQTNENSILRNSKISSNLENICTKQNLAHSEVKKKNDKSFLRMSDRSFLTNETSSETSLEMKHIEPSHSFINFAFAVEQEKKRKYSNKALKRATDLLGIISLNEVTFNHIDIPPMKYDTFIRFFGKAEAKQVFVQTENVENEEIQTDYIEMINKWTQNPSCDNFGCGDDGSTRDVKKDVAYKSLFQSHIVKLSSFLQNCNKIILAILKEDYSVSSQIQAVKRRNELFYSDGYYLLPPLEFLKNIPVLNVYSNSESKNYILTIFDGVVKVSQTGDERGIICIWNILDSQKPEHILIAHSQPTCATFGPSSNSIVVAGMVDGSTLLWDLSDNAQRSFDGILPLRVPTYSTAVVVGKESHHSCVVAIQASCNYSKFESKCMSFSRQEDSKNFHVLTLEDIGIINVWVVVEVLKPDTSGIETDLGLTPGGKLRLVRSSTIILSDTNNLDEIEKINIRTFDFRLVHNDSNRILVTTDAGIVLHVSRQGGSVNPRFYSGDLGFSSEVRCIDCSPHYEDLFLVGCSDGSARLYNLKLVRPILIFPLATRGDPLTLIQWSPIHPSVFVVLSSSSNFYLWNLMEESHHPINSYHFIDCRVTWFSFSSSYITFKNQESPEKNVYMFISRDDGGTEVHIFKHSVSENEYSRQLEYMKSL